MPIAARWRAIDNLPAARGRDAMPGVYELADGQKNVIYIGQSAQDVPNRLRQHLARPSCVRENAVYWRYRYSRVPRAEEAALIAAFEKRHGALPSCNRAVPRERDSRSRYTERSSG